MLVIRDVQLDAFSTGLDATFEATAIQTIREQFPDIADAQKVSDIEILRSIRYGFERAYEYGIDDEENILLYVAFMYLFGSNFDSNPDLPWASLILQNANLSAAEKMDGLYEAGSAFEEAVLESQDESNGDAS